jgi:PadR family transcriptional regulator, regulatory protein PadR
MCEGRQESPEGCRCRTGRMRGFVQPRVLLQLAKKPAHGYELMEALSAEAQDLSPDPGTLYRTLRSMEEDGLVRSAWKTADAGPARRVYELTEEGVEHLHAWAVTIRDNRERLDRFLEEYELQFHVQKGG